MKRASMSPSPAGSSARWRWPAATGARADAEVTLALRLLRQFPAPLAAWKTYAVLGRLRLRMSQPQAAREAFAEAASLVGQIGANVSDEKLRDTFLSSAAVREVVEGAARNRGPD